MCNISLEPLTSTNVTDEYVSWLNSQQIRRYLGIRHKQGLFTKSEIIRFIDDCHAQKRYHWGIFNSSIHIGNVSCSAWCQNDRWIDISYLIGDLRFQGKGIATLSVGAAMKYLFRKKNYNRIQAECAVENYASIKVMENLGMEKEGILRQKLFLPDKNRFTDEVVYSATKVAWEVPFNRIDKVTVLPMRWEC